MSDQETVPHQESPSDGEIAARIAQAAIRANAEAAARRAADHKKELPPELGGPKGPEPTRYGDWERKGIARDF